MHAGAGYTIRDAQPGDLDGVIGLLREAALSIPGVAEHFGDFLVAERDGRLVGAVGLEMRGADAFLRSAVVTPAERGTGIGRALTERIMAAARERGVQTLWLLTTKADGYWTRHGFDYVTRDDVPPSVQASPQFHGACPASAFAMKRSLA